MKDVGILQVKVLKAVDLLAADFSGIKIFFIFFFSFLFISWLEMTRWQTEMFYSVEACTEKSYSFKQSQKKKCKQVLSLYIFHIILCK